jgi:hypothetical protein
MRTFSVLLIALGLALEARSRLLFAVEPAQSAKIRIKADEFGSLADDLGIKTKSGIVEFSIPVAEVSAEVDFYKDGKKLDHQLKTQCPRRVSNEIPQTFKTARFAIHIIDLDQLKLGDGQGDHNRWGLTLAANETSGSNHNDIAKTEIDVNRRFASGNFGRDGKVENRVPVCFVSGRSKDKVFRGAYTPEELIAKNPNTEIAIVYVVWK